MAQRAYWSALVLSARTVVSRPEKEKLRRAAFLGLNEVAQRRSQVRWGKIMQFCAHLADTYLTTEQAAADDRAFFTDAERIRDDVLAAEAARRAAQNQATLAMVGAMGSMNAGMNAAAAGNSAAATQYTIQGVGSLIQANADNEEALAQLRSIQGRQAGIAAEFRGIVAEDVPEIEAGKSFLAETTLFYLLSAQGAQPYVQSLTEFSQGKPGIAGALRSEACSDAASPSPECLLGIGQAMRDVEILVARYERRGVQTPPQVSEQFWRE